MSTEAPLRRLVGRVLGWLPFAFALWYAAAVWHLTPVVWASDQILQLWMPDAVADLRLLDRELLLVTHFGDVAGRLVTNPPPGENLGFLSNPLSYSYSLPLFAALVLATPQRGRWWRLAAGLGVLLLIEVASMLATMLKTLAFDVGGVFVGQQHWGLLARSGAAMAYQFGSLLLPMVAPVVLWLALHRDYLAEIAPGLAPRRQPTSADGSSSGTNG
jgi:hypothetical protein